jgi:AcrR family transcriptional regulator
MAKPLIPVEVIYDHALALIDDEGAQALNARRLASDLKCSTRTLYQQVGNREQLIRALVGRHFSQLKLEFHEYDTWESTALQWSLALHEAMQAHPFLTELMTFDDRGAVASYVDKLLNSLTQAGIDRRLATECCRSLVNTTIDHTIVEAQAVPMQGNVSNPSRERSNGSSLESAKKPCRRRPAAAAASSRTVTPLRPSTPLPEVSS